MRPEDIPEELWEAIKSLAIDEGMGARIPMTIGPYSAFTMVGALQLAWRHPDMGGPTKAMIEDFGRQLQAAFTGGPLEPLLETGWDEHQDRCSGCGVPVASPNPECQRSDANGASMHARGQHAQPHFNEAGGCLCLCRACVRPPSGKDYGKCVCPRCNETCKTARLDYRRCNRCGRQAREEPGPECTALWAHIDPALAGTPSTSGHAGTNQKDEEK